MTYEETLKYIHSVSWRGSKPGLDRTLELLDKIGNPQKGMKFIHVAGTNGKGSFSCMMSNILREAGYRTGLYTSPYIMSFNERIQFNNRNIDDDDLRDIVSFIRPHAESMNDRPTEFELITVVAFEYFKRKKCDYVVLEVGIGGELDSTNVIEDPVLSVICAIGLDHVKELGGTYREIAQAKAGIIKSGCPVVFYGDNREAARVIKNRSKKNSCSFFMPDFKSVEIIRSGPDGTEITYKSHNNMFVPLAGLYQARNLSLVLEACDVLNGRIEGLDDETVRRGLAAVRWPDRFEILSKDPYIVMDGCHNPHGIKAVNESLRKYFPDKNIYLVMGIMSDKDYRGAAKILSDSVKKVFTLTPDNPRSLPAKNLAETFRSFGADAQDCSDAISAASAALECARADGGVVAALGSLYMYKNVREAFESILASE